MKENENDKTNVHNPDGLTPEHHALRAEVEALNGKLTAAILGSQAEVERLTKERPVSLEEANELRDILRTLTNSGTALITSARELVRVYEETKHERDEARAANGELLIELQHCPTCEKLRTQLAEREEDRALLDWLEKLLKRNKRYWPLVHINTMPAHMKIGACNEHHGNEAGNFVGPTLRAAIRAARAQDGK